MRILNRKIFGLHPKVMLPQSIYVFIFVVITLVGPTKVSIMKLKCIVLNRMWQHDFMMKQIFLSLIFLSENTGRLAKQAGYLGHDSWHTRYIVFHCKSSRTLCIVSALLQQMKIVLFFCNFTKQEKVIILQFFKKCDIVWSSCWLLSEEILHWRVK
jgi:hypothetical protein